MPQLNNTLDEFNGLTNFGNSVLTMRLPKLCDLQKIVTAAAKLIH